MKYLCSVCENEHDGFPSWASDRPADYWDVPDDKRESDVFLTSDSCVIADRFFFVRASLDIPIIGSSESYSWGVWISLSEKNFFTWQDHYNVRERSHVGPFFGWLCSVISVYPETRHLKTNIYRRNDGLRPLVDLEPTDHPLSVHQRHGITLDELAQMMHRLEAEHSA